MIFDVKLDVRTFEANDFKDLCADLGVTVKEQVEKFIVFNLAHRDFNFATPTKVEAPRALHGAAAKVAEALTDGQVHFFADLSRATGEAYSVVSAAAQSLARHGMALVYGNQVRLVSSGVPWATQRPLKGIALAVIRALVDGQAHRIADLGRDVSESYQAVLGACRSLAKRRMVEMQGSVVTLSSAGAEWCEKEGLTSTERNDINDASEETT